MNRRFFLHNFLITTIPTVFSALLIGIFSVGLVYCNAEKAVQAANEQALTSIRESLDLMLSEADAQSLNYSFSPHVMLSLEWLLQDGYADKEAMDTANTLKSFLSSSVNGKPFLHSIYIYLENDNGYFLSSNLGLANALNHRDVSWMESARRHPAEQQQWVESRLVSQGDNPQLGAQVITIYKRLYVSSQQRSIGLLVMNIRADYVDDLVSAYLIYPQQQIALHNGDGTLLAGTGEMLEDSGPQSISLSFINEAYDLTCTSVIPHNVIWSQARSVVDIVIGMTVAALLIGTGFAFALTRSNTRGIRQIVNIIDCAERGEPLPDVQHGSDVYGYIVQTVVKSFAEQSALDRQLIEKKYRLEAMQFSFLQSQLNPHFLFNTLKNIFWKTIRLTGGTNDASRMIDLLTGVLYYTLVNRDRFVTLAEEKQNTEKYLEIQQIRFDQAFDVQWTVEDSLMEAKCIKFLLQPILENSISHGLRSKENGRIQITICRLENELCFRVEDNGAGFSPERLEEICGRFQEESIPVEGTGLYNLNKRLQIIYGTEASLKIESTQDVKTVISFKIPYSTSEIF